VHTEGQAVNGVLRRLGRAIRPGWIVVGAIVAGVAGVASEALLAFRKKPEQKDAYRMLDEDAGKS
jgi:hypothetical protein